MKKNKLLYCICKAINWMHWFILTAICSVLPAISGGAESDLTGYATIIMIGQLLFIIFWFIFASTSSRLLYQMWFFLSYILAEYCMLFKPEVSFATFQFNIDATIFQKILLTLICICILACKVYTMAYEKDNYDRGASRRHNNRLDDKIYNATYDLEHARTAADKQRAEARLERAKLDKERYSWDEEN